MDPDTRKYWREQARQSRKQAGRPMGGGLGSYPVTVGLIIATAVMMVVGNGVLRLLLAIPVLGSYLFDLATAITPSGVIGLIFSGLFIWLVGSQVELLDQPWKYLVIFFVAGGFGALVAQTIGGFPIASTFAPFALAGILAHTMSGRGMHFSMSSPLGWLAVLLILNIVLSGFDPVVIGGMVGALAMGWGLSLALRYGER
ncbi:MAG: rhomboid family protein [Sulfobacillus sp.]